MAVGMAAHTTRFAAPTSETDILRRMDVGMKATIEAITTDLTLTWLHIVGRILMLTITDSIHTSRIANPVVLGNLRPLSNSRRLFPHMPIGPLDYCILYPV